ncbi:MAG: hypothetical protein E6J70_01195 [Deltaproteobacteria bacterium]|nr:MAG: hypothetical protein E6J70_01195 [Deltaproteobacteria bacterium]
MRGAWASASRSGSEWRPTSSSSRAAPCHGSPTRPRASSTPEKRFLLAFGRLRASGAPAAEIRALRERSFGADAADRLEQLDRQRAVWQQRLDDYREARDATERNASLDAGARDRAIETLRAERITPEERLRVVALDRIREDER